MRREGGKDRYIFTILGVKVFFSSKIWPDPVEKFLGVPAAEEQDP